MAIEVVAQVLLSRACSNFQTPRVWPLISCLKWATAQIVLIRADQKPALFCAEFSQQKNLENIFCHSTYQGK